MLEEVQLTTHKLSQLIHSQPSTSLLLQQDGTIRLAHALDQKEVALGGKEPSANKSS